MTLPSHWALEALGDKRIDQARAIAHKVLVSQAVGDRLNFEYAPSHKEVTLLQKSIQALELAAYESWNALLGPTQETASERAESEECCSLAFTLSQALPLPKRTEALFFHILHLIALGYVGQRWSDVRRWIREHSELLENQTVADSPWDKRVLSRLFDAWICLCRKDGWDDLHKVAEIVAGLRTDQSEYEDKYLMDLPEDEQPLAGWTLVSLYHWAAATEKLATYMMQGSPRNVEVELDIHYQKATEAATASRDVEFDLIIRWLHVASKQMIRGSLWQVTQAVNSRFTKYVKQATSTSNMFEMLPPQRAAVLEEGLLDPAKRSIVINLPTSAGKTTLAVFRILQALNQFAQDGGWVAYTAPTRALVAQLTIRMRRELGPIGVQVERLSGAIEVDYFEEAILEGAKPFDVLVTTPEKLDLVIRQMRVKRPLVLVVVDEAHNIEDTERGLKLELLLATVKRDCEKASFLLLTPFVPNGQEIAEWLSPTAEGAKSISVAVGPWKPNERVVGLFYVMEGDRPRSWSLKYKTLQTTPATVHLGKQFQVGGRGLIDEAYSTVRDTLYLQAAGMAKAFSDREESLVLAIATRVDSVWSMAGRLTQELPKLDPLPDQVRLVQRFLASEISANFDLVRLLEHGIAVHHSGLSEETRTLVERLAEDGLLRVICATTTVAQGINFPVSSVFLSSTKYPYGKEMPPRDFWNLAGRAGRVFQESLGVVGIAAKGGDRKSQGEVRGIVNYHSEALVSTLIRMVEEALAVGGTLEVDAVIHVPQWREFWGYLAHVYNQTKSADDMAAQAEQILRNTLGYRSLEKKAKNQAKALLQATRAYGRRLAGESHLAALADATGFSPESLRLAIGTLKGRVQPQDWQPTGLFGGNRDPLRNLMGIMLRLPETQGMLQEITSKGLTYQHLADMTVDWVQGESMENLAQAYFQDKRCDLTRMISNACKAIYGKLSMAATWGVSALSKLPTSGLDFESLSDEEKRTINSLPAMIYYGVPSEDAVLMRMNGVPRSAATPLGKMFMRKEKRISAESPAHATEFVRGLKAEDWDKIVPRGSRMNGEDYRKVWVTLSGETTE